MERSEEALSTRDLASPNDPASGATAHEDQGRQDGGEEPIQVYDQPETENVEPTRDRQAADRRDDAVPRAESISEPAPQAENATTRASSAGPQTSGVDNGAPLLPSELSATLQRRWEEVQTRFVDQPRGAVEDADGLVAELMQKLAEGFAQERERLEAQWDRGEDISTEDLRVALQRYRSFFQRLLST
ncbi:MAG: hypothetical protein JOZ98_21555 [Solirubrobacterales bacterium]|nr:hypothetical protein [Solirubrobacterales bacterium]MBV9425508.1 hypothetical protein [Solirubrobacterales bacterium]MBV9798187.1 hypothetical protein [Solirubrobacterales bacterium]